MFELRSGLSFFVCFFFLDPDMTRQNMGLDLDPNCLTLCRYCTERCFLNGKSNFEENQAGTNNREKLHFCYQSIVKDNA